MFVQWDQDLSLALELPFGNLFHVPGCLACFDTVGGAWFWRILMSHALLTPMGGLRLYE